MAGRRMARWYLAAILALVATGARAQRADLRDMYARGPHVGPVEQALVGIEVTNIAKDDAARQTRRGCGFLLRCDGFVLAPTALFDDSLSVAGQAETAGKQSVTVTLFPGTDHEQRGAGSRPRYLRRGLDYAVFKLNNFHAPALRAMLPDALQPGDTVQVVWTAWNPALKQFLPLERRAARLGPLPQQGEDESEPGFFAFAEPLENVPAGAVVLGPGGVAVGLVPGAGTPAKSAGFLSFAVLDRATNCVTPQAPPVQRGGERVESRESRVESGQGGEVAGGLATGAAVRQDRKAGEGTEETPMVSVPGGPVTLPPALLIEQPDMEGADVACVAPFEIDRTEVTNAQYLAYWQTLPRDLRNKLSFQVNHYPFSWEKSGAPFPAELADYPVLGVPLPGARDYAKAHGKRLPTPYEWCLAALGSNGERPLPEWAQQYIGERRRIWERICQMHEDFVDQHPELRQAGVFHGEPNALPWIVKNGLFLYASQWSQQIIEQLQEPLWGMWRDPTYLMPVGARDFDTSPCGAKDMILNAAEIVAPYPGPPTRGEERYLEMSWTVVPPRRTDRWQTRQVEALPNREATLPPLSRLYRRALFGPTSEDLLLWSSLSETAAMLGPLAGWQLRVGAGRETATSTWARGANPYETLGYPAGYTLWRHPPRHFRREMGRAVALNTPDAHVRPGLQLFYILPVGFRCAK